MILRDYFYSSEKKTISNLVGEFSVYESLQLEKRLPVGTHYVKLIVHGDHSFVDLFIAVAPIGEQFVVFSVDGSLTASVSVTGRDPRVRPGVVDVVRYWHNLVSHCFILITKQKTEK